MAAPHYDALLLLLLLSGGHGCGHGPGCGGGCCCAAHLLLPLLLLLLLLPPQGLDCVLHSLQQQWHLLYHLRLLGQYHAEQQPTGRHQLLLLLGQWQRLLLVLAAVSVDPMLLPVLLPVPASGPLLRCSAQAAAPG
jgi:hypothetical protein